MRGVWHIVVKDLRRMAAPAGFWLCVVAGAAIWFHHASPGSRQGPAAGVGDWLAMTDVWVRLIVTSQFIIGYLLAGALVVEDAAVGTDCFWMTRPIGRARLFAAKLIAAVVLFVAAPALVLGAVWLAGGFSLLEAARAAAEVMRSQLWVTLPALAIGALAKNLVQFLLSTVLLCAGGLISSLIVALTLDFSRAPHVDRAPSTAVVIQVVLLVAVLAVAWHQYRNRRTARTWALIAVVLPSGVALQVASPYLLPDRWARLRAKTELRSEFPAVALSVPRVTLRIHTSERFPRQPVQSNLTLEMAPSSLTKGVYFSPAAGWGEVKGADGVAAIPFRIGGAWGHQAAVEAVLGTTSDRMKWNLFGMAHPRLLVGAGDAQLSGHVDVWLTETQVLGEIRPTVGAEIVRGASRTRVVTLESPTGWQQALVLQESDSPPAVVTGSLAASGIRPERSERWHDIFVLANRGAQRASVLTLDELGAVAMRGQVVGFRRLYVPMPSAGEEWRRDAVIIKVRLQRTGRFFRAFETAGSVVVEERLK